MEIAVRHYEFEVWSCPARATDVELHVTSSGELIVVSPGEVEVDLEHWTVPPPAWFRVAEPAGHDEIMREIEQCALGELHELFQECEEAAADAAAEWRRS